MERRLPYRQYLHKNRGVTRTACNASRVTYVSIFVGERLYNEKEVREILKRASERRSDSVTGEGVSLSELRQIGAELGFDPNNIELAAQSLTSATPSKTGWFSGRTVLDQVVEGEVRAEDWLGMVAVIQRHYKGSGAITQRGSNYDWAASEEGRGLALSVSNRGGRSLIRLESNQSIGIFFVSLFCPIFALVFALGQMKHGYPLAAIPTILIFFSLMFGFIRAIRQQHQQSVASLMERLINEMQAENTGLPLPQINLPVVEPTQRQQTAGS